MGLTQFQLAEKVDISPQYEGKIERGEKQFSFETIAKLSVALNTSLDYHALYKYTPICVGVWGLMISSAACFIFQRIQPAFYNFFWICVIIFSTIISVVFGFWLKRIMFYAYKDPLTGLYNRRYFYEKLESDLKMLNRSNSNLSLCIIDIDHFKKVNDRYGHLAGDKLLTRVSKILKANSREIDTIARWGGEEFAVILPDTDNNGALKYAERR